MNLNKSFQKIFGTDMNLVGDIEPAAMPPKAVPTVLPVVYALGEVREYHGEEAKKRRLERETKA